MARLYFSRPQPLSPTQSGSSAILGDDGRWYRKAKGGKLVLAKGVPMRQSIYFWWFEYLKRSEKYKKACEQGGKGMKHLYEDFGDVFSTDFWTWWKARGAKLFGEVRSRDVLVGLSASDVTQMRQQIEKGEVVLLSVPTTITKTTITHQLKRVVRELEVKPITASGARYPLTKTKVDVESLDKCLTAYDLHKAGRSNVEIGGYFRYREKELRELSLDSRKKHTYIIDEAVQARFMEENEETEREFQRAQTAVKKRLARLKKGGVDARDEDVMLDKELGILTRRNDERRKLKNYLNVSASRMIKKAEANIRAVEQGHFPVGHGKAP